MLLYSIVFNIVYKSAINIMLFQVSLLFIIEFDCPLCCNLATVYCLSVMVGQHLTYDTVYNLAYIT